MLKADITDKYTKIEINGSMSDICTDVSRLLSAINERLTERDIELGHNFRMIFTKGFMDGICFNDDREHMNHYLAEADAQEAKHIKRQKEFVSLLDNLLEFMKDKRAELKRMADEEDESDEDE